MHHLRRDVRADKVNQSSEVVRLSGLENGSVTAEFALALPSVAIIIAIVIGSLAAQIERLKLVSIAATAARAVARGEEQADIGSILKSLAPDATVTYEYLEDLICATASRTAKIADLPEFQFGERQCFRKLGL